MRKSLLISLLAVRLFADQSVTIRVKASGPSTPSKTTWNYFGYDEPNFTYTAHGRKLLHELRALSPTPVHVRTHFLLATGDGKAALKWGSTNVYTEDAQGRPIYNWTIVDKILDTYVEAGIVPFVEIGFMPEVLSKHPHPYQPVWKPHIKDSEYYTGWTYPPNDYGKWSDLIYQLVKHCITKYGQDRVAGWDWEVWNEPNISYWHGTPEEYNKLYDYTTDAIKRALPSASVGGPASTGPGNEKAAEFLEQFLQHCTSGKNAATGTTDVPLDFISFHAKGKPDVVNGHVRMGIAQELKDVSEGFHIVRSFPQIRDLPIILTEADPEGCAACSARVYPPNAYRNGTLYAAYEAAALKAIRQLASHDHVNLKGVLTWAFEFEDQPYFDGLRALATNGIDKPVLNFFRMAGFLRGSVAQVDSSADIPVVELAQTGVREKSDVDVVATRTPNSATILIWNYHDSETVHNTAEIELQLSGLPSRATTLHLHHYRIDENHSNAYTVWKSMGSPQSPSPAEYQRLETAGKLQLLEPARAVVAKSGSVSLKFPLPSEALSLLDFTW
jgi:xylan 1,4-beta-xylosidase